MDYACAASTPSLTHLNSGCLGITSSNKSWRNTKDPELLSSSSRRRLPVTGSIFGANRRQKLAASHASTPSSRIANQAHLLPDTSDAPLEMAALRLIFWAAAFKLRHPANLQFHHTPRSKKSGKAWGTSRGELDTFHAEECVGQTPPGLSRKLNTGPERVGRKVDGS
jgi:hypothetical protein